MTEDLLEIPAFLKREKPRRRQRGIRRNRRETTWNPGVPVKRPTKAQVKTLVKRQWSYQQAMRLTRHEATVIIRLGVGPDARFTPDKKTQFPDKKDEG